MATLEITERAVGDITVVKLVGRLILEEGDTPFRDHLNRLAQAQRLKIVVDLENVTYIDSAGLGALVAKYVTVRRRGGDVKLLRPTRRSQHLLAVTRLAKVFEVCDSEAEAVRSFEAEGSVPGRTARATV